MEPGDPSCKVDAHIKLLQERFQEELGRRDGHLSSLLSRNAELEAALSENERLREENKLLKAQLDAQGQAPQLFHLPFPSSTSSRDVDALDASFELCPPEPGPGADESTDLFLELVGKVSTHYRRVKTERERYKTAYKQITLKFREQMRVWKGWQRYYSTLERRTLDTNPTDPDVAEKKETSEPARPAASLHLSSAVNPDQANSLTAPAVMEQSSGRQHGDQDKPVSTQDTEEEVETEQSRAYRNPSLAFEEDDTPIIISEHSLKRKRKNSTENISDGRDLSNFDGSVHRTVRIKGESSDIDQVPQPGRHLRRTETLDLESVGSKIITPKKHQRFQELLERTQRESFHQRALQELRQDRSKSLPLDAFMRSHRFSDKREPIEIDLTADQNNKSEDRSDVLANHEPQISVASNQPEGEPPRNHRQARDVLSSLSPNAATGPRTPAVNLLRKDLSSFYERSADAIPLVTEDGEDALATRRGRRGNRKMAIGMLRNMQRSSSDSTGEKHGRLHSLLDSASPARTPLSGLKAPPRDKAVRMHNNGSSKAPTDGNCMDFGPENLRSTHGEGTNMAVGYSGPAMQDQEKSEDVRTSLSNAKSTQRDVEPSEPQLPQQQTPLRFLPTSVLRLSDFKPNPKVNHDLDFAFKETVRNRDARRCLPGCTDPNCCGGTFRRLAEIGGLPNIEPVRGLWDESLNEDDDPETCLLAAYLGISADDVSQLSAEERQNGVIAARAEMFANQVGKHRQQWERARSPPGFWNADFPGTQTQMRDRIEAVKREREKVEERAREARREGGKWIFRDEASK